MNIRRIAAPTQDPQRPRAHPRWDALAGAFQPLANYNFRVFWLGMLVAALGVRMHVLAITWLMLRLSNSPMALGTMAMIEGVPILLFALVGGALADRWPRRRLILVTRTVMLIEALSLAVVVSLGLANLWVLFAFAAAGGALVAVDMPCDQAFLEELVGPDQAALARASAVTSTLLNVAKVVGALAGGFVIATLGEASGFYFNALGVLAVIAALLAIDRRRLYPVKRPASGRALDNVKAGISYAARTPDIAAIVLLLACLGFFGFNLGVLLPLIVRYVLDSGPFALGILSAALGAGSLAGSLTVDYVGQGRRRMVLVGAATFAMTFLILPLPRHWAGLLPAIAMVGFCSVLFLSTANARLHLIVPHELRGRLMGIYTLLIAGTAPFGGLLAGALAGRVGIRETTALLAAGCILGVAVALVYIHRRRNDLLPEPEDEHLAQLAHLHEVAHARLRQSWYHLHRS